jgi:hypothetical protein
MLFEAGEVADRLGSCEWSGGGGSGHGA